MKNIICLLCLLVLSFSCTDLEEPRIDQEEETNADLPRYEHHANLQSIVLRVINPDGYGYDPAYVEYISKPSLWYSDFFGIQALQELKKEEILKDFVPDHAELVSSDSNTVVLNFEKAGKLTFFIHTSLFVRDIEIPHDHVSFEGDSWQEFTQNIENFKKILADNKLEEKYLIPNTNYELEKEIYDRLQNDLEETPVVLDAQLSKFAATDPAILIFPDLVHGDSARFYQLKNLLQETTYDWVALEMLSDGQQETMNTYLTAPESSEAFKKADQELRAHYKSAWAINTTNEDPWMEVFSLLKEKGKKVYGMEPDDLSYLIFRFGETEFGGAVRNIIWASHIPEEGKGIVFGGKLHFTHSKAIDFQDFAQQRNEAFRFFSMTDL